MSKIWLYGAVIFVIALVVAGVVVALVTTRGGVELFPADSPEGAVQRYLLAFGDEEYREAYDYLSSDVQRRCSLDDFLRRAPYRNTGEHHMTLEDTQTLDDSALVRARVTVFDPGVPFGPSEHSYDRTFQLKLEEGQWRLTWPEWWCSPPY
jgi:hypothetical protein